MKATLTLEGSAQEIRLALERIIGIEEESSDSNGVGETSFWTETTAKAVFRGMSWGAREVYREIASVPEPYPIYTLMEKLGLNGNALGGTMSSPTRQMRIQGYSAYPNPAEWRNYPEIGLAYTMNPVWRKIINDENQAG